MHGKAQGVEAGLGAGAFLTIDLGAVAANWTLLNSLSQENVETAGVLKADGYGLGALPVAKALLGAGCRRFFVALPDEGVALREGLRDTGAANVPIHVLNGLFPGAEHLYQHYDLIPTLNHLGEVAMWRDAAQQAGKALPAILQVDSGMTRLGLPKIEQEQLFDAPDRLQGITLTHVMSHLASADEVDSPQTDEQAANFATTLNRMRQSGTTAPASLCNTAGTIRSTDLHHDLVRPGCGIYGINPLPTRGSELRKTVRLQAKILQVQRVDTPQTVGYGAAHKMAGPGRIATISAGYADGYLRTLSGRGTAWIGETPVPVIGRVSMDLVTLDVTSVPEDQAAPGHLVDLIGPGWSNQVSGGDAASAVGHEAMTIGYEILTGLGARYARRYINPPDASDG